MIAALIAPENRDGTLYALAFVVVIIIGFLAVRDSIR